MKLPENIILIGMPASGKSTVGVLLAKEMGYAFADSDLLLQEQEKCRLHEMISREGMDAFLRREERLNAALKLHCTVLATGGSAIYSEKAMINLKNMGLTVYLELPQYEIAARISNIRRRGVVLRPGQTLAELYAERIPYYEKYADITVHAEHLTPEQTVDSIMEAFKKL